MGTANGVFVLKSIKTQHPVIRTVRYNEACEYALTCGSDRSICLWNPVTGVQLKTYSGHSQDVHDAVSSVDNSEIASAGGDKSIFLYDVITGVIKRRFTEHLGSVNCVRYNSDSSILASASEDNSVKLWDCRARANASLQTLSDAKDAVTCLHISEYHILAASLDRCSRLYDIRGGQMVEDYLGCELTCCRFGGDCQLMLFAGLSTPLRLLDRMTGELFTEYSGASNQKYRVECSFAADDKFIVSGSEDGNFCVWNLVDASVVYNRRITTAYESTSALTSLSAHRREPHVLVAQGASYHLLNLAALSLATNAS